MPFASASYPLLQAGGDGLSTAALVLHFNLEFPSLRPSGGVGRTHSRVSEVSETLEQMTLLVHAELNGAVLSEPGPSQAGDVLESEQGRFSWFQFKS